jgi:ATP-dependent helicase/DNAse subunit B
LRCPLDFHFHYVLGMKEAEETDVRIPSNLLGEALHHAVEQVYRPWLGKPLQIASLEEARGSIESLIREDLGRKVPVERLQQGQPLLQMRMAVHAAQRFLRKEMDLVRTGTVVTPIALEEAVEYPLEMAAARIGSPVLFTGRLDRVDRKDGLVRILDMKTGRVDPRDLKIKEFSLEGIQGPKGYAVQLMVYAWLYLMQHPETDAVQAGILPLQRGASNEPLLLELSGGDTVSREDLPAIGQLLAEAVQAMMDPALPVQHNKDSAYCKFCLVSSSPN